MATHGLSLAIQDSSYRAVLNSFDLICPDGMPVAWTLLFLYKIKLPDRVCGPDLVNVLLKEMERKNLSVFFYGSTQGTLDQISARLPLIFPNLKVAGYMPSKFKKVSKEERDRIINQIKKTKPDVVLVGLGCPLQEKWVFENANDLDVPCLAVGGAFLFLAGTLKRPPNFMKKNGLEWFYRWYQEPRRLFHRYFILGGKFLLFVFLQKLGLLKFKNKNDTDNNSSSLDFHA